MECWVRFVLALCCSGCLSSVLARCYARMRINGGKSCEKTKSSATDVPLPSQSEQRPTIRIAGDGFIPGVF